jgi:hypothetical protein
MFWRPALVAALEPRGGARANVILGTVADRLFSRPLAGARLNRP